MRYLIIILYIISYNSFAQNVVIENDSLILWQENRKLTWDDFKGAKQQPKDVHLIHQVAESSMIFPYSFTYTKDKTLEINIKCYFEKFIAWTITNDIETLEHEQIHFDIGELYTRKIRKCVKSLQDEGMLEVNTYINEVNSLIANCNEYQEKYDSEVLLNYEKQQEWQERVAKEFEE
ncbi:hypothetical protein AB832_03380, partial [Flavobacteriaceae bacterium (ex Bugula neritina AB1)]